MATAKQKAASRRNLKKARAAKRATGKRVKRITTPYKPRARARSKGGVRVPLDKVTTIL